MSIESSFTQFLADIRLPDAHRTACKREHTQLRERLAADPDLKDIVVATVLQGSYRRATLVRPGRGDKPDVDVVVVTTLDRSTSPAAALQRFQGFLRQHYGGQWKRTGSLRPVRRAAPLKRRPR